MLWNNHFLMGNLIWCGPWRVVNTCLTKQRFFVSLIVPSQQVLFNAFSFDLEASLCLKFLSKSMLDFNSVCLSLSEWQFVNELARVTAPGGTIIIVTWCHRDLAPTEESLQPWEKELLNKICDSFYLPAWCSTAEYVKLLQSLSLQVISNLIILAPHASLQ